MRAVAQRVSEARVVVDGDIVGEISRGLLVYLGAGVADTESVAEIMANKLAGLRIFEDAEGKMSRSVEDIEGGVLVVPQFTLFGDVRKGRRPNFMKAAKPELANPLFEKVVELLRKRGLHTETGRFREMMDVQANVWGPITILIDTEKTF